MRAVALLSAWKIKNAFRTLISDPRKFGPFIVFIMLMVLSICIANFGLSQPRPPDSPHLQIEPDSLRAGVTLCMILLGLSVIDSGLGDTILAFGLPDVDYLFPSPISRRIVLAYRLPSLTLSALFFAGFVLFVFSMVTRLANPSMPHPGHFVSPGWVAPAALAFCVGTYLNLAIFVGVWIQNRHKIHRALMCFIVAILILLSVAWWRIGSEPLVAAMNSPWVRWPFFPSSLASDVLVAGFSHLPAYRYVLLLFLGYMFSLAPMFLNGSNWYEQSIVSTERITAIQRAAKGGYSSLMAARSANFKHKGIRPYTVSPFGTGAVALFWAHLCAAAKRPWMNFVAPLLGGIAIGALGAVANINDNSTEGIGFMMIIGLAAYASMAFMTIAKTASEGAIRRREIVAPLPIRGWQAVVANLAVPFLAILLFCLGNALAYSVPRAPFWPMVAFGFGVALPIRMAARMAMQYVIVLGYPDFADKIQQVVSTWVYMLVAVPFIAIEVIACIPAMLMQSMWIALITLAIVQIPILVLMLFLAGKASEKAIATGEPVRFLNLIRGR